MMARSSPPNASWTCLRDRKSTRLNSSHGYISYAVFCLKKKKSKHITLKDTGVALLSTSEQFSHRATTRISIHTANNRPEPHSPLYRGRQRVISSITCFI